MRKIEAQMVLAVREQLTDQNEPGELGILKSRLSM